MKIYKLSIQNFRGIQTLDWNINSSMVCLIGPGNSTKTTILEAIYLSLCPIWNPSISDVDFYQSNIENPILITITVGELPDKLLDFYKFSNCYGGRDKQGNLKSEGEKDDEPTLTIEFKVDSGLEPKWALKSNLSQEEKEISHRDRSVLCVFFLGNFVDREFSWSKGSAISKLTTDDDEISRVVTKANRSARRSVDNDDLQELKKVAQTAKDVASKFGVFASDFRPALDSHGWGTLSL